MPTTRADMRLPSYEGHLFLNRATLPDIPQSSSCTSWYEQWCSLEDGKLLIYPDRTAALIDADERTAVIDICDFASVKVSDALPEQMFELVLSTTASPVSFSGRLFRPKSISSLHRLSVDQSLRWDDAEPKSRPPTAYQSRVKKNVLPLKDPSRTSARADDRFQDLARRKPWSKVASARETTCSQAFANSNNSQRTMPHMHHREDSTSSSAYSTGNSRASTDIASSGFNSPRTPLSPTFSDSTERITIRVASVDSLSKWIEAFSLTIKMCSQVNATPSSFAKHQTRALTRPSLTSLPGFRTPSALPPSPVFTCRDRLSDCHDDTATPRPSCGCQDNTLALALSASRSLHGRRSHCPGSSDQTSQRHPSRELAASPATGATVIFEDAPRRRPSAANTLTSVASKDCSPVDAQASKRDCTHKRSISSSSSFFGGRRLSGDLRNSLLGGPLNSSSNRGISQGQSRASSLVTTPSQQDVTLPSAASPALSKLHAVNNDEGDSRSSGQSSSSRHRRSGSLLQFGSSKVLNWRETFNPGGAEMAVDTAQGLDLLLNKYVSVDDKSHSSTMRTQGKTTHRLPRLRSLLFLPTSKVNSKERVISPNGPHADGVTLVASPASQSTSRSTSQSADSPQSHDMPRSTSWLSLTKNALSSMRGKSSSRQTVGTECTLVGKTDASKCSSDSTPHLEPCGCGSSHELAASTRQTISSSSSVLDSAFGAAQTSRISLALDERAIREVDRERLVDADLTMLHSCTDDTDVVSSPSFSIERILPPEQMIDTFDQLRAADPKGRSCDWLGRIETASQRDSVDWTTSRPKPSSSCLRTATSQSFISRDGGLGLTTGARLRGSTSAWHLPVVPVGIGYEATQLGQRKQTSNESSSATPPSLGTEQRTTYPARTVAEEASSRVDMLLPRSLPAPPRSYKRRARLSKSSPARPPLAAREKAETATVTSRGPFADVSNTSPAKRRDDGSAHMVHKLQLAGSLSRSPRKDGARTRRRSLVAAQLSA